MGHRRDACLPGELFCRRPILRNPAPPPRRAPRPDPPVVCLGSGLDRSSYIGFNLIVLRESVQDTCRRCLGECKGQLSLGRSDSSVPVLPGCAPPRCSAVRRPDPTRLWYVRVLGSTNLKESIASPQRSHGNNREPKLPVGHGARYGFLFVESKARTYHGRIGAGRRTAEQRGGAE